MRKLNISEILSPSVKSRISFWCQLVMFFFSVITVGAIVVDYGFVLDAQETSVINKIYQYAWWVYLLTYLLRLMVLWRSIMRKTVVLTIFMGALLLLSALPKFITLSAGWMWLSGVWTLFSSKFVLITILGLFALLNISQGIVNFINKKTNPALLMAACFAVIIIIGALLLLLPRSTLEHIRLPIVDALFVSTSAVCVTGLTPVDISQTFSLEGQIIIALLIQIGGLGVMTITSFFAVFFMGGTSLYNQFALRDMVGSDTFSSLMSTLLYILGFTFVIEAVGAFCIWLSIHSTMGMTLDEEIFFSIFHAVSAFCNAGFSTLTGNLGNPDIMANHSMFYLIITMLIVLGGVGFPILMNFWRMLAYYISTFFGRLFLRRKRQRYIHLFNINTKIVLRTTFGLILLGTLLIAFFEWNGALAGFSTGEKLVHSLFNAVVPRTAGFNSVDLTEFSVLTILVYIVLMWIGGASQSTAGGIKVNTFAVAVANFLSVVKGRHSVTLLGREISAESVRRVSAVIFGSIFTIFTFFTLLVVFEPTMSLQGLLFETVSAISTVGSSLNITPALGADSKIALVVLMFIGRVGLITVLMSVVKSGENPKYRLPKDNVIIN